MALNRSAAQNWGPATKGVIKGVLTLVVLVFVARHVAATRRDLLQRGTSLRFDPAWLSASVGLYLLGLLAFGAYFWRVLASSESPVGFYPAVRAYLVSHLAKYVPGKAMVVVVRCGLAADGGARPATAAFATLYETLAMMAAGGLLAALGFWSWAGSDGRGVPGVQGLRNSSGVMSFWEPTALSVSIPSPWPISSPWVDKVEIEVPFAWLALLAGLGLLVVVWPRVFPRLAGLVRVPFPSVGRDALPRFSVRLLVEGLAWATLGWVLLGLGQVAVVAGVSPPGMILGPKLWPIVASSVAFATVVGFAVPISPGGLGVREWVLWTALGATLDRDSAVVVALVLRLVWVVGEVGVAVALLLIPPRSRRLPG